MQAPMKYGSCDCFIICLDAVRAVTGVDPLTKVRGAYRTPEGAARLMRKRGFRTVEKVWASLFDPIHPASAKRGDILIFDTPDGVAGAPLLTQGAFGKDAASTFPVFHSPLLARAAFRVE